MQVGDRIQIREKYPEILQAFFEENSNAEMLMREGAEKKKHAAETFWASISEMFPETQFFIMRLNRETGEVIATNTAEFLQDYHKQRNS